MLINDERSFTLNEFRILYVISCLGINSFSYIPLNIAMIFPHFLKSNMAFARHEVDELPSAMAVYISSSNPLDVYRKTKIFKCVLQYSLEYLLVKSLVHSTYIYNFKSSYLIEFAFSRHPFFTKYKITYHITYSCI